MTHMGPQFDTYHTAKDFIGSGARIYPQEADSYVTDPGRDRISDFWSSKRAEGEDSGLYDDIESHGGIHTPVEVYHPDDVNRAYSSSRSHNQPYLDEGYHRVVAAYDLYGPEARIPVKHTGPRAPKGKR